MHSVLDLQKQIWIYIASWGSTIEMVSWSASLYRYGKQYSKLIDSSKLMLDLTSLTSATRMAVIPFPTLIQTGTESFELIRSASLAPRVLLSILNQRQSPKTWVSLANDSQATSLSFTKIGNKCTNTIFIRAASPKRNNWNHIGRKLRCRLFEIIDMWFSRRTFDYIDTGH